MNAPEMLPAPAGSGQVELCTPHDWVELLAENPPGPEADAAARARFFDLIQTALPTADPTIAHAGAEALMAWRARMLSQGVISHGVINVPLDAAGDPLEAGAANIDRWACWHILTAVLHVPPISPELDLGEFVARVLGQHLDPSGSYLESFVTEVGCGTGLLLTPILDPSATADPNASGPPTAETPDENLTTTHAPPTHYGLAAALTCPPGGGTGLLVTGVCLDPVEIAALGAVVAVMAARSRVLPPTVELVSAATATGAA
ncbi:MAG: hypothetical protein ACT4P1_04400 [Sporichthyaceae bacterium]